MTRADEIAPIHLDAIAVDKTGRPGPVLVDITKDAQQGLAKFNFATAAPKPRRPHPMLGASYDSVSDAAEMIRAAKRPVILAGHGVIKANATEQMLTLSERLQIPVATTLLGLGGFPASHPLALGMMGMHGESWVNDAIQKSDLLIACGMRFDDRVTGTLASYAPHAKKIHIEIDPAEINKNVRADVALIGDLREVLELLLPHLSGSGKDISGGESAWVRESNQSKGESAVRDIRNLPDLGHLYAAHVMHDLWRVTEGNAIVATDVGQHQMWEAQYYRHEQPRTLITSGGLGTMGFALPAGIGAKVACPDREVWVIAGDGGFQMTACELSTIAQENLDINIAVVNNGYLGMVRQWQEFFYDKNYASSPILSPDFVKLADAHGIPGATVRARSEVDAALALARITRGPFLINFLVEKEESVYPMIPAGAALHEMIRRPAAGPDPMLESPDDM